MDPESSSERDGRRAFCRACIGGMTVVSIGAVGYPVVSFLGFPQRLSSDKPLSVALAKLPPGQAQYLDFRGQQIIVLAREAGKATVLSASCTHLGCNVIWDSGEQIFRCPCHGAMFDADGNVIKGPANKPLEKIPYEVKDGSIIVT